MSTSALSRKSYEVGADDASAGFAPTAAPELGRTQVRLKQTFLGLIFVINAYVVDWLFAQGHAVASASAMIGAILLGGPIVWTAIQDLRRGLVTINELVGLAVLASFASEDYKTAGVVAFL